jgi:gluconolactonase
MREEDFKEASAEDRRKYVVQPYEGVPLTKLVPGSTSHLVSGDRVMVSFLAMEAGSTFDLHSHPEEQIMIVLEGYCDEVIEDKMYRVAKGDVIWLPSNIKHGGFVRDVDCKIIDVFAPPRSDYREKFLSQNSGAPLKFKDVR